MFDVLSVFSDPAVWMPLGCFLASQPIVYFGAISLFPSHFASVKQRSWILTTYSSLLMTLGSLPFLLQFVFLCIVDLQSLSASLWPDSSAGELLFSSFLPSPQNLSMRDNPAMELSRNGILAKSLCAFFISYCVSDLTMGALLYPSQMNWLTGWFHHSLYVFLVSAIISWKVSGVFCIFGILEAPTLLLALGSINPSFRRDYLYGALFFSTRIVLHLVLAYRVYTDFTNRLLWIAPLAVFPLHIIWFHRWVRQQVRIWRTIRKERRSPHRVSKTKRFLKAVGNVLNSRHIEVLSFSHFKRRIGYNSDEWKLGKSKRVRIEHHRKDSEPGNTDESDKESDFTMIRRKERHRV